MRTTLQSPRKFPITTQTRTSSSNQFNLTAIVCPMIFTMPRAFICRMNQLSPFRESLSSSNPTSRCRCNNSDKWISFHKISTVTTLASSRWTRSLCSIAHNIMKNPNQKDFNAKDHRMLFRLTTAKLWWFKPVPNPNFSVSQMPPTKVIIIWQVWCLFLITRRLKCTPRDKHRKPTFSSSNSIHRCNTQ